MSDAVAGAPTLSIRNLPVSFDRSAGPVRAVEADEPTIALHVTVQAQVLDVLRTVAFGPGVGRPRTAVPKRSRTTSTA